MIETQHNTSRHFFRWLPTLALSLLLSACAGVPLLLPHGGAQSQANQAEADVAAGQFEAAAKLYLSLADTTEGTRRAEYLIRGGDAALRGGDTALANQALNKLRAAQVNPTQRPRGDLLAAGISLAENNGQRALQRLPAVSGGMPPELVSRILLVKGKALFQVGQSLKAVQTLEQRTRMLTNPQAADDARQQLWQLLQQAPLTGAGVGGLGQADKTTQGWFALARIDRSVWMSNTALDQQLDAWLNQYPQHPAAHTIVPQMRGQHRTLGAYHGEIALVLPLQGQLQAPASAIRDGFLYAYYRQSGPRPPIHIYVPGNVGGVKQAYQQALQDGASAIVGPLSKSSVNTIARTAGAQTTVLALNYADTQVQLPSNFFEFGLSPTDEAAQIARRAVSQNLKRALVLVPEGPRGRKIASAFRQALHNHGGTVVDQAAFDPHRDDHRSSITYLLQTRARHGTAASRGSVPYDSHRRNDMDFIFLAATPQQARQIRPELRFYHATRVPVYATSSVYTGDKDPEHDRDMDGIRFCDMPWTLDGQGDVTKLHAAAIKLWPNLIQDQPRLFALGYDAYHLLPLLKGHALSGEKVVPGLSGALYLDQNGHILHRRLTCAEFRNGIAVQTNESTVAKPVTGVNQ